MAFVPTKLATASAPPMNHLEIDTFAGANLTDAAANVKLSYSPSCANFIRESPGKVRKWIGHHTVKTYPARINGVHFIKGVSNKKLVHAGASLYLDDTVLYGSINDSRSVSRQVGKKLYIQDGKTMLVYDGTTVVTAASVAFVPTVIIASTPSGGGTLLYPVNLLTPKRKQTIIGDGTSKVYQLSTNNLDADPVIVKKLNAAGGWDALAEGVDFTVNRPLGQLTFVNVHPPITAGIPNLEVELAATKEGYADRVNKCDISTLYGVGANQDRMFVSGNPDYPNYDWYSQQNDPTYFGDTWYSILGQDNSAIMGYSIVNDMLAAHKDRSDNDTNIFLRKGQLFDGKAAFVSSGSYQGTGAVSKYAFGVLATEPMFLTTEGIFAVTPSDMLGERYAENRSYYLNGVLTKEHSLMDAVATVYDRLYMVCVNGTIYALDGMQTVTERSAPYSTRQYVAYYRKNVPARVLWVEGDRLCFGTAMGEVNEFYTDYNDLSSFSDNGAPIKAKWYILEFSGKDFSANKQFRRIALMLGSAIATGARVWAIVNGIEELVLDYNGEARYFSYSQFSYSKMSYKTDKSPQELIEKYKSEKVKKISFAFENDVLDEPFSLYRFVSDYTESR